PDGWSNCSRWASGWLWLCSSMPPSYGPSSFQQRWRCSVSGTGTSRAGCVGCPISALPTGRACRPTGHDVSEVRCRFLMSMQAWKEVTMYARIAQVRIQPERVAEATAIYRDEVVPALEAQRGFRGVLLLTQPEIGRGISITLWETEADRTAGE